MLLVFIHVFPENDEVGQHAGRVVEAPRGRDVLPPFYGRVDGVGGVVDGERGGVAGGCEGEEIAAALGGDDDAELGVLRSGALLVIDASEGEA
jgi:hypothetical protein